MNKKHIQENIILIGMLRGLSREEECVWINKKAIKKEEKKQIKATLKSLVKSKEISNEFRKGYEVSMKINIHMFHFVGYLPGIILFMGTIMNYPKRCVYICLNELNKMLITCYKESLTDYSISFKKQNKNLKSLFYNHHINYSDYSKIDRLSPLLDKVDKIKAKTTDNLCTIVRNVNNLETVDLKSVKLNETSKDYEVHSNKLGKRLNHFFSKKITAIIAISTLSWMIYFFVLGLS